MSKFEVGQEVIVTHPYGRDGHDSEFVSRVGRQYVYVERYGQERKFSIETGQEQLRGGYLGGALYTQQEWEDREARSKVYDQLHRKSLTMGHPLMQRLSLDQLGRIAAILEEEA